MKQFIRQIEEHVNLYWDDKNGIAWIEDGRTGLGISVHANINSSGSVSGMKTLGYWGNSIEIIKEIVAHFGGGWVDENDCDDKEYYPIEVNTDGSVKPIKYVTMKDIYEKFGSVVVITE